MNKSSIFNSLIKSLIQKKKFKIIYDDLVFYADEKESVLNAALKAKKDIPYNCGYGVCLQCKCMLVNGKIYYKNSEIDISEEILSCQAVPKTDLIIKSAEEWISAEIIKIRFIDKEVIEVIIKPEFRLQFVYGQYCLFKVNEFFRPYSIVGEDEKNNLTFHIKLYKSGKMTSYLKSIACDHKVSILVSKPKGKYIAPEKLDNINCIYGFVSGTGLGVTLGLISHTQKIINKPAKIYALCENGLSDYQRKIFYEFKNKFNLSINIHPIKYQDYISENFLGNIEGESIVYMCGSRKVLEVHSKLKRYKMHITIVKEAF